VVIGIHVTLGVSLVILKPPWEAPDEIDHVRNVQSIAAGDLYEMEAGSGLEANQPPLYYALLAGWQRAFGQSAITPKPTPDRECRFLGFAGFSPKCWIWRHDTPEDDRDRRLLLLLRLPGVALSAALVAVTAATARRISSDPWTPVLAAAFVAFVPRLPFVAAGVTNDVLINALGGIGTYFAVSAVTRCDTKQAPTLVTTIGLGAVAAGLLLTKLTGVLLIPAFVVAVALSARTRREALRITAIFAAVALALSSAWLAYNISRHGDPLALAATEDYIRHEHPLDFANLPPAPERAFVLIPKELWSGFWYQHQQFTWSRLTYLPFWALTLVGMGGLFRRGRRPHRDLRWQTLLVLGLLVLGGLATLWVIGLRTNAAQARVVYTALPALGCLVALGYERLPLPTWPRFALPALGLAATCIALVNDVVSVS